MIVALLLLLWLPFLWLIVACLKAITRADESNSTRGAIVAGREVPADGSIRVITITCSGHLSCRPRSYCCVRSPFLRREKMFTQCNMTMGDEWDGEKGAFAKELEQTWCYFYGSTTADAGQSPLYRSSLIAGPSLVPFEIQKFWSCMIKIMSAL